MIWNRLAGIALGGLVCTSTCHGWGSAGHRIIGYIASTRLTDEARLAMWPLLGDDALWDASLWADEIRDEPQYAWSKPLHYVNIAPTADGFVLDRDCRTGECVVGAILHYRDALRDPKADPARRAEALRFLLHFVGDLHQPLHAGYARDRGGNSVQLDFYGRDTNLHRVWDSDILDRAMQGGWRAYAQQLDASITAARAQEYASTLDPSAWATESFAITRSHVYSALPASGDIGDAYFRGSLSIVNDRLAAAGVRLAGVLNEVFGNEGQDETPEQKPADTPEQPDQPGGATGDPDPAPTDPPPPPPPPAVAGAAADLRLVEGEACGSGAGKVIYLVNGDDRRLIRVRLRRSWTDRGRIRETFDTFSVRPGEANRKELGCSVRRLRSGEIRSFTWEIVEAEYR